MSLKVKKTNGRTVKMGSHQVEAMRMQMDWQIRQAGYEPASVTAALLKIDNALLEDQKRDDAERIREDDFRERFED